ncbi:hypothetical protein [Phascolarctid gammaherpesvirus 1]|uniref:Uncharacterized protein n=1 Tax=Phascolarctid gammaherpesvirus 1 TaxID=2249313 RepID=A0A3S8D7T9_9GAMA|nr:hypothetical protein KM711_gp72 [Phascolarctid gammaherpesvirus 1]AZB49248.1 hypothetical protein [Phascolarctid gammaherpesvirus 1]
MVRTKDASICGPECLVSGCVFNRPRCNRCLSCGGPTGYPGQIRPVCAPCMMLLQRGGRPCGHRGEGAAPLPNDPGEGPSSSNVQAGRRSFEPDLSTVIVISDSEEDDSEPTVYPVSSSEFTETSPSEEDEGEESDSDSQGMNDGFIIRESACNDNESEDEEEDEEPIPGEFDDFINDGDDEDEEEEDEEEEGEEEEDVEDTDVDTGYFTQGSEVNQGSEEEEQRQDVYFRDADVPGSSGYSSNSLKRQLETENEKSHKKARGVNSDDSDWGGLEYDPESDSDDSDIIRKRKKPRPISDSDSD